MRYIYSLATTRRQQHVRLHLARGSTQACWLVADLIGPNGASLVQHIEDWHNRNSPGENSPQP